MSDQHDGGAAFLVPEHENNWGEIVPIHQGMTLRDYFMASVTPPEEISHQFGEIMVGPYPTNEKGEKLPYCREVILWWADVDAAWRSIQADAMLKAREQEGGAV